MQFPLGIDYQINYTELFYTKVFLILLLLDPVEAIRSGI